MDKPQKEITVGMPLFDGVTLLDFAGATQVFAFAQGFQAIWLAEDLTPVATIEGVTVNAGYTFDEHPPIDVLFVPGGSGAGIASAMQDDKFQAFIRETAAGAQWSGSVCNGAFIIAAAGLLDKCKRVTTYWSLLKVLDRFPSLSVETSQYPRSSIDHDHHRFTGGGISSSIDLALELVEMLAGTQAARISQLQNQYAPNPPVHAGDPSQANDPALVNALVERQQELLIGPISEATDAILEKEA